MKKIILQYGLILLVFSTVNFSYAESIYMNKSFKQKDIFNALEIKNNTLQPSTIFYLKFYNQTGKNQQFYLSIINPTIDKIVIYEQMDSLILGDKIPFSKRKFKHINAVYPIFINNNESKEIKVIVYNSFQHLLNYRINIATENSFIKTTNHDYFFNGIFYGVFFMFLLLLISIYIFSKSKFFLIYIIINVFLLFLIMEYNGTGYQFIWFYSSFIQNNITAIVVIGYLTAHILFIRSFFSIQLRNYTKNILYIFLIIAALFGMIVLIKLYNLSTGYLPENYYYLIISVLFITYGIFVMLLGINSYIESKRKEFIWVCVGMLLHIFNWTLFINNDFIAVQWLNRLNNIRLVESNLFLPHLNYIICLFEMFIVTVFIANNYHILIRQNDLSFKRLEFYQKRNLNTFIIGQEEEREKITNEMNLNIYKDIKNLRTKLNKFTPEKDDKNVLSAVITETDKVLSDIQDITSNYVAPDMQLMKLIELITTATDKLYQQFKVEYNFEGIRDNFNLSAFANVNLYRIFQELSNNALKHSNASKITITAIKDANTLQIKLIDDGVGFDGMENKDKGIGLMNIESRMIGLNGHFYIMSNINSGTTIHLIMNLKDIC